MGEEAAQLREVVVGDRVWRYSGVERGRAQSEVVGVEMGLLGNPAPVRAEEGEGGKGVWIGEEEDPEIMGGLSITRSLCVGPRCETGGGLYCSIISSGSLPRAIAEGGPSWADMMGSLRSAWATGGSLISVGCSSWAAGSVFGGCVGIRRRSSRLASKVELKAEGVRAEGRRWSNGGLRQAIAEEVSLARRGVEK